MTCENLVFVDGSGRMGTHSFNQQTQKFQLSFCCRYGRNILSAAIGGHEDKKNPLKKLGSVSKVKMIRARSSR